MSLLAAADYNRRLPPARVISEPRGPVAQLDCVTCGATGVWNLSTGVPGPDVIHNHFRRKGWDIGKKRATCPECIQAAKIARQQKKEDRVMSSTVTPFKPVSDNPTPSDAAKKAKRMVYMSLEEFFVDTTGQYKEGYSDKSIADLCDVSEAFVKQIREEDFGPLKLPADLQSIADDLKVLAAAVGAAEKNLHTLQDERATLQRRFDNLCVKHGWAS